MSTTPEPRLTVEETDTLDRGRLVASDRRVCAICGWYAKTGRCTWCIDRLAVLGRTVR